MLDFFLYFWTQFALSYSVYFFDSPIYDLRHLIPATIHATATENDDYHVVAVHNCGRSQAWSCWVRDSCFYACVPLFQQNICVFPFVHMAFKNCWVIFVGALFDHWPEHVVLHRGAAKSPYVSCCWVVVVIMHSMRYGKVRTLHTQFCRVIIH